jgi:DNA-binding transcriptional ArsR family regulator
VPAACRAAGGIALADPTRRRVLVHLTGGPGYPAEMAADFGTTRANLSNHLACLRECGPEAARVHDSPPKTV